jgi:hypothetical protein
MESDPGFGAAPGRDDLVERVARAIERSMENARLFPADKSPYEPEARAAIAVALEEAARVCRAIADNPESREVADGAVECETAILALIHG